MVGQLVNQNIFKVCLIIDFICNFYLVESLELQHDKTNKMA